MQQDCLQFFSTLVLLDYEMEFFRLLSGREMIELFNNVQNDWFALL